MVTYTRKVNIFRLIIISLGVITISCLVIFFLKTDSFFPQEKIEIHQEVLEQKAFLIIDNDEGSSKEFEVNFREGMTAFDLLKDKTVELNLTLRTKVYDIGVLIEAIGDKENGQDGRYWMYYVNGEMPMVAADKKEIKVGDRIEFKFEKSPF